MSSCRRLGEKEFRLATKKVGNWIKIFKIGKYSTMMNIGNNNTEIAMGFKVPFKADSVLSPQVHYGEPVTGIYFVCDDDNHGRITFENLDSIKVSRGEYFPFKNEWKAGQPYYWVTKIKNSKWLIERYNYEATHYGSSYEFGGNVDEMLSDFNHYVFSFHDQFVEVIARGIWFEKDSESLLGKDLSNGHPFLPISTDTMIKFEAHGLICQARINPISKDTLRNNALFCSQKLIEFALELDGKTSINHSLLLSYRNNECISSLRGYFGKPILFFKDIVTIDVVKPQIEAYMKEVAMRRKKMGK